MTSSVVLFLTCVAYFTYELITFRDTIRDNLSVQGEIIAANSTAALAFEDKEYAVEVLNALKAEPHIVAACIYDKEGAIFSKFPDSLDDKQFPSKIQKDGYQFTGSHIEGFTPIMQGDSRMGTLYVKSDIKALYARLRLYGLIAFLVITVSFLLAYLFSNFLQKSITKPILDLAGTAKIISAERDYSVRAVRPGDDEVGLLTDAFNQMLDQIQTQNREIIALNQTLEQRIKERTAELEKTNEKLKQQNEFVETIIDSSIDLIAVFDLDLNYLILNKHAEKAYNIKKEALVGKNVLSIFPDIKDSDMLRDLKKALDGEIVHNTNYTLPVLNKYFETYYVPIKDNDNTVRRILMVAHDITAIMEANQNLQLLNEELEKSNQSLEQFAYITSHDLQEPLRKIQIFSEMSENSLDDPAVTKSYLGKINSSAHRLSQLIRAILNYSRLSKSDTHTEEVDLNKILENIKIDLELLIAEKNAVIQSGDLPVVRGIPLQLNQLFFNLLTNSLKFCEKQPFIHISCNILTGKEKELSELHIPGSHFRLSFTDNGIGFEQQYAGKVFDIFQRVHNNVRYSGTGIGLALCKKIVDNHHGKITVTSSPGEGTTFFIYLPCTMISS